MFVELIKLDLKGYILNDIIFICYFVNNKIIVIGIRLVIVWKMRGRKLIIVEYKGIFGVMKVFWLWG